MSTACISKAPQQKDPFYDVHSNINKEGKNSLIVQEVRI